MVKRSSFLLLKYKSFIAYLNQKSDSLSPETKEKLKKLELESIENISLFFRMYASKHKDNLEEYVISWLKDYNITVTDIELTKIKEFFTCLIEIAGKFKKLDDFTWNMIHAKKNEIVGKISTLLKPIRNYSRKNKRELIQVLGVMKEKVQKFY